MTSGPSVPGTAALRGALGFLTRLPFGRDERAWDAFRTAPVVLPVAGAAVGIVLVLPLLLPVTPPTVALAFAGWVYAVTGILHLDGLGDLGDAVAVHGDPEARRRVMADTTVGIGAVLSIALVVVGLALAALALAPLPVRAVGLVVAAEVGAKLGMATVVCLGAASHRGLGAQLTDAAGPRSLAVATVVALPAALVTWPNPAAGVALLAGPGVAVGLLAWSHRALDGVNGDVIGAANELGRLVALHAGVIAWTRF